MAAAEKQQCFLQGVGHLCVLHSWQLLEAQVLQPGMLTGHKGHLASVVSVFAAQKNHAPVFYRGGMKELAVNAVD